MKGLIASVVLLLAVPCLALATTWDTMLNDQPAAEQAAPAEVPTTSILGKPVAIPPSLKPAYVERVRKVAPNLASMCPGFSAHPQALGEWSVLSSLTSDDGVMLQVRIAQPVPQIGLPAGANCFYEILPDGTLGIAKSHCRALCSGGR